MTGYHLRFLLKNMNVNIYLILINWLYLSYLRVSKSISCVVRPLEFLPWILNLQKNISCVYLSQKMYDFNGFTKWKVNDYDNSDYTGLYLKNSRNIILIIFSTETFKSPSPPWFSKRNVILYISTQDYMCISLILEQFPFPETRLMQHRNT